MDNTNKKQDTGYHADHEGQYDSGLKSLVRSLQISFFILVIIIVGMLLYFFTFGGYFIVKPQEAVIVLRFGKYVDTYTEDWHWFFPHPVNSLIRIKTNPQILTVDFKASSTAMDEQQAQMGGPLDPGRDSYLLTGDANIIHASWILEYQVVNPQKYYEKCFCPEDPLNDDEVLVAAKDGVVLGTRGPQTILRETLRNVVLRVTAGKAVDDVLYEKKQAYKDQVQALFDKAIADLDIGIKINSVALQQAYPPQKTKAAFGEVTAANQAKSTMIDTANEYRVKLENSVLSEKAEIMAAATTYKKQIVSEVKAENIYFEKINAEYAASPDTVLMALYNYTLSDVLGKIQEKYIVTKGSGKQQQIRLKINPEPLENVNKRPEATEGK
ncbi:MAG: protease modulator HflK [Victivallaceae bacterium]|jgi:membrane protease subunit HflK